MTPDEPDDPRPSRSPSEATDDDLWSGTEMVGMVATMANITKLCANATKAILDGRPDALAGTLGTIIGRAETLREHVWEYTRK